MRRLSRFGLAAAALHVVACGGGGRQETGEGGDGITTLTTDEGEGESAGEDTAGVMMKLDVEEGMEAGEAGEEGDSGCKKVDLLFVIDNSGSMEDEQQNLLASFPGFISGIQEELADTDGFHVGITTSDAYLFNTPPCNIEGALVTRTGGTGSSNSTCGPYLEGGSFITEMDNLNAAFQCAAQVGIMGDGDERPMTTMNAAVSPALNGVGACNEGFIRDDALLVVVIITDEEDDHEIDGCDQAPQPGSLGEPTDWFESLVAVKGDINTNVVVLSLAGPPGPQPAQCPALDKCAGGIIGAEVANRIAQFTNMFEYGFIGRVCEPNYDDFFAQAVGVIKSACDDFEPIG